jgi:hypothetical protein
MALPNRWGWCGDLRMRREGRVPRGEGFLYARELEIGDEWGMVNWFEVKVWIKWKYLVLWEGAGEGSEGKDKLNYASLAWNFMRMIWLEKMTHWVSTTWDFGKNMPKVHNKESIPPFNPPRNNRRSSVEIQTRSLPSLPSLTSRKATYRTLHKYTLKQIISQRCKTSLPSLERRWSLTLKVQRSRELRV